MEQIYVRKFEIIKFHKIKLKNLVLFLAKIKLESVLQNTANNYLPKLENVLKKVIKDIKNINPKTERNFTLIIN